MTDLLDILKDFASVSRMSKQKSKVPPAVRKFLAKSLVKARAAKKAKARARKFDNHVARSARAVG